MLSLRKSLYLRKSTIVPQRNDKGSQARFGFYYYANVFVLF